MMNVFKRNVLILLFKIQEYLYYTKQILSHIRWTVKREFSTPWSSSNLLDTEYMALGI